MQPSHLATRTPDRPRYGRPVISARPLLLVVLAAACLAQGGCLAPLVADRLIAPTNDGPMTGVKTLTAPSFFNGGGSLPVGPPEAPATIVWWVVEPGPLEAFAVPGEADAPAPTRPERWLSIRARHPQLEHDVVLRRPLRDAGPQPLGQREARATVFLLQGWGSRQRTLPYLWHLAGWLADAGCRVVLPDLRAQGDSSGKNLTYGFFERRDLAALATHLEERGLLEGPLGVVGHSYGGATAIQWAAVDPRVQRVLSLSPYADGKTSGQTVRNLIRASSPPLAAVLGPIFSDAFFHRVSHHIAVKLNVDVSQASPIASLPRIRTPLLLVHGTDDLNVPVSNSVRLEAARPQNTELWLLEGADHFTFFFNQQDQLRARMLRWVEGLQTESPRNAGSAGS